MLENLVDAIAEIIYENEMVRQGSIVYVAWDYFGDQEYYMKVAEEIVEIIQENVHLLEN